MITKKFEWMYSKSLIVSGLLFFMFAIIGIYRIVASFINIDATIISVVIGSFFLVCIVMSIAASGLSTKVYVITLLTIAILIRLFWVLSTDTQPISDFLFMHNAALSAAQGDFSFGSSEYFISWAYQVGFTLYQALLIKLFGTSMIILQLFNIIFSAGTAYVIYLTAAKVCNEFCGRIAILLYTTYIPNIILCSVLTNQHQSTFFFFLGSYFIISKGLLTKYNWIIIGLCFGLGNLFRPLGSFFIIGTVIYIVLFELFPFQKKQGWTYIRNSIGVIVIYVMLQQLISLTLVTTGITPSNLTSKEPYWKFVVGLNQEHTGTWSLEDANYVAQYTFGEERNRVELQMIQDRVADKVQLFILFMKKFTLLWGSSDSSVVWSIGKGDESSILRIALILTEGIQYFWIMIFGFLSLLLLLRKNEYPKQAFFLLLLLGYAFIHLFIEIQTRYRFDIMPCIFILQCYGIYILHKYLLKVTISIKSWSRKVAISE